MTGFEVITEDGKRVPRRAMIAEDQSPGSYVLDVSKRARHVSPRGERALIRKKIV
jgi:hypothetical protein